MSTPPPSRVLSTHFDPSLTRSHAISHPALPQTWFLLTPAREFHFVPVQRLFSSFSLNDDLRNGVSYFRAEALRAKAIAQAIADGYSVVALLDEPFKGTNVKDALDASLAILKRFATKADCLFVFSSHLIELSEALKVTEQIRCGYFEAEEGAGRLRFDYLLRSGISKQRLGMRVLQEEGVFELLDRPVRKTPYEDLSSKNLPSINL